MNMLAGKGAPKELRRKVKRYYDHMWKRQRTVSERKVMELLPHVLRRDVRRALNGVRRPCPCLLRHSITPGWRLPTSNLSATCRSSVTKTRTSSTSCCRSCTSRSPCQETTSSHRVTLGAYTSRGLHGRELIFSSCAAYQRRALPGPQRCVPLCPTAVVATPCADHVVPRAQACWRC